MSEMTFLTRKQLQKLKMFKKAGIAAEPTDFCVLMGGAISDKDSDLNQDMRIEYFGNYWTCEYVQRYGKFEFPLKVYNISSENSIELKFDNDAESRYSGARPVLPYSSIKSLITGKRRNEFGTLEVTYGEYPQSIVSDEVASELNNMFENKELPITGRKYTVDNSYTLDKLNYFSPVEYEEYEYRGERYIRCIPNRDVKDAGIFTDGRKCINGQVYWVKVEPIKWQVDRAKNVAVSKKLIFANVQFNHPSNQDADFEKSDIKKFMDEYFAKEIVAERNAELTIPEKYEDDAVKQKKSKKALEKEEESQKQKPKVSEVTEDSLKTRKKNYKLNKNRRVSRTEETVLPSNQKTTLNNEEESIEISDDREEKNRYNFEFEEMSEEETIRGALESNIAVFLHGKSSDGKSARVKQIDPDCEIIYLRNATPESLNGKSAYNAEKGEMIDIPPSWYTKMVSKCEKEPNKLHVLFLDEITNAMPSIQGMAFNIVLDKEVNGKWKLPDNCRVIAAGNDLQNSSAAYELAEPLFNRFAHVYIETTQQSWLKWAAKPKNNIHPSIYAYIAYNTYAGKQVLRTEYTGKTPNADPRKWEMASKALWATGNPTILRTLIGDELTKDFIAFCKKPTLSVEDVVKGNYSVRDFKMYLDEKIATAVSLSSCSENEIKVVREFVGKLGPEVQATFDVLWAKDDEDRMEQIAKLKMDSDARRGKHESGR